uniref:NADH-ubiquinone oxidoreductase chain 6 n=1 Tax=Hemisus marmoratus TaxID=83971 RepID=S4V003_9NEOB|nr:NADH dehydrogenase subunit 6 [Hemisus marmoratus]
MIFEFGLVLGLLAVASNPSPYFAVFGLVGGAGAGCLVLMTGGGTFLSLVLFLVYLGGMMVVFAYSVALVAEPYPEAWGSSSVVVYLLVYSVLLGLGYKMMGVGGSVESLAGEVVVQNWVGVSGLFYSGGWVLSVVGWGLLLTLFVALEVVRGHYSGALRAV